MPLDGAAIFYYFVSREIGRSDTGFGENLVGGWGQMNEEPRQSSGNQDQVNEELEQSESSKDQLIEIYKLQSQLAISISNRRTTIHKFYMLLMSGLTLIFPAFFKLPTEIRNLISIEFLILGLPLLGITLSVTWFIFISSNLRQSIIKYEALKKLEDKLEYQFFKDEWKYLEKYQKGKAYWETSYVEIFIPVLFFIIFTLLLHVATGNFPNAPYAKLHYYPGILTGVFSFTGIRSWQIDREIRGMRRWTDGTVSWVSLVVPLAIIMAGLLLFRYMGCGGVVDKEVKTLSEKSAETSSGETTKKQIVTPDEK